MTSKSRRWKGVADDARALYELPLGLASFAIFKLLRRLVYRIGRAAYRKNPGAFQRWNVLSGEVLGQPHQLSRYMVVAPRWNPHAAVGAAGPLNVHREIRIELSDIPKDVDYWFFGALEFPSFKSAGRVSSLSVREDDGSVVLRVPPGDYYIACRYYGWRTGVRFPAISSDGKVVVQSYETAGDINEFYSDLHERERGFYRVAHFHMYVMLKYRSLFSTKFVRRHLLPVGNEDTQYFYGTARAGQSLRMVVPGGLFRENRVFFTFYNTSSLPVAMFELTEPDTTSDPLPCKGAYLLRIMRICGENQSDRDRDGDVVVSVVDAARLEAISNERADGHSDECDA